RADGRRAECLRDLTEGVRRIDVARWCTEVRPVGQVEYLRAELSVARTANRESLRQGEVQILIARCPRDADAAVAPRAERRSGEPIEVQPMVQRLIGGNGIADAVLPLAAAHGLERRS